MRGAPMNVETLDNFNRAGCRLPLSDRRLAELAVELAQFSSAMENVRDRVEFDADVSDFSLARSPGAENISND
jgi:hypothetical protein